MKISDKEIFEESLAIIKRLNKLNDKEAGKHLMTILDNCLANSNSPLNTLNALKAFEVRTSKNYQFEIQGLS